MVFKIISGGQTGADTGGLYGARDAGIPTGGFAPYSFCTEKGYAPWLGTKFGLVDSGTNYKQRTAMNVGAADITLWFGSCAAILEGFVPFLIEKEPEYVEIAKARLKYWSDHKCSSQ